jgi:hypothetical protein
MLKKIAATVTTLHESCEEVAREIEPIVQREADIYQKKILGFEEEVKVYGFQLLFDKYKGQLQESNYWWLSQQAF